jgi:endonuclease/exonuclease/phosphatase (EEP) superfamily protein YafD
VNRSTDGRVARWVGHALLLPVWLVVLGLLSIVIAHVAAYDHDHLFFLANSYTLWILRRAYPISVAALCFRAWPLALAAGVIVVAHLVWVVPPTFRTVPVPAAAAHAPHLRVASANVRYDNLDHRPLLAELQRTHADIIVMEEVTPAWWRAIVAGGLVRTHPVVVKAVRPDPGGMVVLSRHPLTNVVVHHADGWPIITATLALGGRAVHLAGVHLVAPLETFDRNQRAQRAITGIARGLARPRVVVGDFNASPYNRWFHQLLDLGLRDAAESVGRPFATTWPNGRHLVPPLLLDHLFADPPIVPLHVREGRGEGSDHRPIVVDLAVTR